MMKNEEIYNIFDTTKILKRPMGVIITDKSGIAGIAHWVNSHLGLDADKKIDKRHPGLAKMNKWVMEQYEQGRTTSISHDELLEKAKKYLPEYFVSDLDKLKKKASGGGAPHRRGVGGAAGDADHGPGEAGAGHGEAAATRTPTSSSPTW